MAAEAVPLDRRQRRRLETIEEVLDVAVALMGEQGVAGLSIGEVARRMGIRPPSLYVYFDSKNALYDGLFARGSRLLNEHMGRSRQQVLDRTTLDDALGEVGSAFARWSVENPAYSQLLFWRPVPGFQPSAEAYEPAVESLTGAQEMFSEMQRRGWIRSDAPIDEVTRDWTILLAGVISQQLSNGPHESFAKGSFTKALPRLIAMFAAHYAAPSTPTPRKRPRHAYQR
jgi:AcrR family transcriptional regulator